MAFGKYSTASEVASGHDLTGMEAIVTGGAGALGLETAKALAGAGARVVLAGRDPVSGAAAAARLRTETGNDLVVFETLDLGSLSSVATFACTYVATGKPLHILINNAGVMAAPLARTADGFESQFGINHLGHFALTVGLLPALRAAGGARVVSLSSRGHRRSDVDFDDPNYLHRPYEPWVLPAAEDDDVGAIHGDDEERTYRVGLVVTVSPWSSSRRELRQACPGSAS